MVPSNGDYQAGCVRRSREEVPLGAKRRIKKTFQSEKIRFSV